MATLGAASLSFLSDCPEEEVKSPACPNPPQEIDLETGNTSRGISRLGCGRASGQVGRMAERLGNWAINQVASLIPGRAK